MKASAKSAPAWTATMAPELQEYYLKTAPLVKQTLELALPRQVTAKWIAEIFRSSERFGWDLTAFQHGLVNPVHMYLDRGGKMLRPVLTAMTLEALGVDPHKHLPLLGFIEVMEDATIALDDVFDGSDSRRGGPCAHLIYGDHLAANAGTTIYQACMAVMYNNLCGWDVVAQATGLDAFAYENILMTMGQSEELAWSALKSDSVTESGYLQESLARIAFLSFRGPVVVAARAAGAPTSVVNAFSDFGAYIGLAYHLHGDNLNLAPASEDWGKVELEDITTGRRTMLIISALNSGTPADRERLLAILDSGTRDEALKREAGEIILRSGAVAYCTQRAEELGHRAMEALDAIPLTQEYRRLFEAFAYFCFRDRHK